MFKERMFSSLYFLINVLSFIHNNDDDDDDDDDDNTRECTVLSNKSILRC